MKLRFNSFLFGIIVFLTLMSWCEKTYPKEKRIPKIYIDEIVNKSTEELISHESAVGEMAPLPPPAYFVGQERSFELDSDLEFLDVYGSSNMFLNPTPSPSQDNQDLEASIHGLFDKVMDEGRFVERLDSGAIVSFPIGIGSEDYAILINDLIIRPEGTFFNAYMSFTIPTSGEKIAFMGRNIPLSSEGGLSGDVKLELITSQDIKIGDGIIMTINGEGKTYVSWDCEGFKEMAVDADVLFDPGVFAPEDVDGNIIEGQPLRTNFSVNIADWNDLIVSISIDPFQIRGLDGVGFSIQDAVFDFSDYRNAPNVQFPANYISSYFTADNPNLWRGIYIREAAIRLPKQFKTQEGETSNTGSAGRIGIIGTNLIIDEAGFSGTVIAENLLTLEQGKVGDWAFSLERIGVTLEAGQLTKAGFEGQIVVPIMDKSTPFTYTALIDLGNEYTFNVSPAENMKMDIWSAQVNLKPTSYLEIKVVDDDFAPIACLHGNAKINIAGDGIAVGAAFEGLVVQTKKPYVSCQTFSLGLDGFDSKAGNFPISINNVGFKTVSDTKMGITFDLILNLVGEGDGGFGAEAGLMVVGSMDSDKGISSWRYEYLELTKIVVDISGGAYKIHGSLTFFKNDETYGNGFNGQVSAEFIGMIKVDATAIFGKVDNYRYWYVDALATFSKGIPVGMFQLTSFGGGAFHYMRQLAPGETVANSQYGTTISGIVYKPDKAVYLGIKASVGMSTVGSESVFNGDATLEVTFGNGGGIRTIDFRGNAYFLVPPIPEDLANLAKKAKSMTGGEEPAYDSKGSLSGHIRIYMDFPNKILHANIEVYVEIAGGLIKGVGKNNLAGWAVFHFEPGEWYIHMGSPDRPVGIELLGFIKLESYFMVGHNIPGSPPPPPEVSKILGGVDLDYMGDLNALGEGKGIAFGSRFSMRTGDLTFLIFYASFSAGMGFDIMMKDYGEARCMGSTDVLGVNGWYANGQSFAFFEGKVGISVKIFGKRKKFEILELGAAAVMQAKLPNPFWMRGIVGGYYSVLGGLIKGNCRFEVTLGEECEIVPGGSVLEGLEVISQVTPVSNSKEVNVFTTPQAVFNMPVDKQFSMVDVDEIRKTFRIKLDKFTLYKGSQKIAANFEWNDDHTVLLLNPIEIMPGESDLKVVAQISFEERKQSIWEAVKVDGEVLIEQKEASFVTDVAPDYIPWDNVSYSYPIMNQYNFHKDEYNKGYVKLKQGQTYLFEPSNDWIVKGRFITKTGQILYTSIDYSNHQVNYSLPANLANNTIYTFDIVNLPKNEQGYVDQNIYEEETGVDVAEAGDLTITTQEADEAIQNLQEKLILTTYFRTSRYSTFAAKMNAVGISTGFWMNIHTDIYDLGNTILGPEMFDKFEIYGDDNIDPLIQFEAVMTDNYFVNDINPLIYNKYRSQSTLRIKWRDENLIGTVPTKAFFVVQIPSDVTLTEEERDINYAYGTTDEGAFMYDLIYYYHRDFVELRTQAANKIRNDAGNLWYKALLETKFPKVYTGTYPYKVKYVLPGTEKPTTTKDLNIKITL